MQAPMNGAGQQEGATVKSEALGLEEEEELRQLVEEYTKPFEERGPRETGKLMTMTILLITPAS